MQEINMLTFISLKNCGNFCNFLTMKRARARAGAQKITKARARAKAQPFFGPKSANAANFGIKGALRSVKMWTTNFYKSFFKKFLLYMSSRLSTIRSVHTYVMPRTVYFG